MDFAAGVYLSEARNPIPPPPPYPLFTCIQYTYSHREGGESWTREKGVGQQLTKLGQNTNITDYISSLKTQIKTPAVPIQVNFFRWRHFALVS